MTPTLICVSVVSSDNLSLSVFLEADATRLAGFSISFYFNGIDGRIPLPAADFLINPDFDIGDVNSSDGVLSAISVDGVLPSGLNGSPAFFLATVKIPLNIAEQGVVFYTYGEGAEPFFDGTGTVLSASAVSARLMIEPGETLYVDRSVVLSAEIENTLLGPSGSYEAVGNAFANFLAGNDLGVRLFGLGDADTLVGGAGTDEFTGGIGNDTILGGEGIDTAYFSGNYSDYSFVYY